MPSDLYLRVVAILASYFLQVSAAYVTALALGRMAGSPQRRFLIWRWFMICAGLYWIFFAVSAYLTFAGAPSPGAAMQTGVSTGHPYLIPTSWSHIIAATGRILVWCYFGCTFLLLLGFVRGHVRLSRALRYGMKPSKDIEAHFSRMCRDLGVRRCELLILPGIGSPATAGVWQPRILLPEACEQLSGHAQLTDILWHELVHVVRRDYLWACVGDAICCGVFFHPAIWQARKEMRLQRELACDWAVVAERPDRRADYAACLTRFARLRILHDARSIGIDFAASASLLSRRIRAVLEGPKQKVWWETASKAAGSVATLTGFYLLFPLLAIFVQFAPRPVVVTDSSQSRVSHLHLRHVRPGKNVSRTASPEEAFDFTSTAANWLNSSETNVAGLVADKSFLDEPLSENGFHGIGDNPAVKPYDLDTESVADNSSQPAQRVRSDPNAPIWSEARPGAPSDMRRIVTSTVVRTLGDIMNQDEREHEGRGRDIH